VIQPLGDSGRGLSAGHTVLEYSALGHRDDRPRVPISGPPSAEWNGRLVVLLLYAGIPGTALAYWVTAMASSNLSALTTALGLLATPVVSVPVATLWLGEPLTLPIIAAIVLILGGIAIDTPSELDRASRRSAGGSTDI
jgi:EamA-like transporter family